jgi:hypothetical protein
MRTSEVFWIFVALDRANAIVMHKSWKETDTLV